MSAPGRSSDDSFPRRYARTRRFTLGRPRRFTIAPDGSRVVFLRSSGGEDPVHDLWTVSLVDGVERRLADARALADADADEQLPPEERSRRERARESASGIVSYACDRAVTVAAFALHGRLFTLDLGSAEIAAEAAVDGVFDPRPDPATGARVAYAAVGAVHVVERGGRDRCLIRGEEDGIRWGVAEFVAAEEMGRTRGLWWSPDGRHLAVTRVDERPVGTWHIADPARPDTPAVAHRYPAAGSANAEVTLHVVPVEGDGDRVEVVWDRGAFPYLAVVRWDEQDRLTLLVQSRDQRRWQVLLASPSDGRTEVLREDHDARWLDLVPGAPAWAGDRLVMVLPTGDGPAGANHVLVDGEPRTPTAMQVREVVAADEDQVWFTASGHPTVIDLYRLELRTGAIHTISEELGITGAVAHGATAVVVTDTPDLDVPAVVVRRGADSVATIASRAAAPDLEPNVEFLRLGDRELVSALVMPRGAGPDRLPVLMDPYGGPHAQRVLRSRGAFLEAQWFADQGFAVLVVDGRGTPGRGPVWERAIAGDLATPVLEDQVQGLHAAAEHEPRLDLERVAIRGWSFGGFLAALAVLRRPDVFRAGIAGAPVTDWRLYDTHYTERYLGQPDEQPAAYRVSSLVDEGMTLIDAAPADGDTRPGHLLVIHGLADDNVVAAHSLRLSQALLAAGRPHRFLPLSGVTHMTPQEVVAENLLRLQVAFLHEVLGSVPTSFARTKEVGTDPGDSGA